MHKGFADPLGTPGGSAFRLALGQAPLALGYFLHRQPRPRKRQRLPSSLVIESAAPALPDHASDKGGVLCEKHVFHHPDLRFEMSTMLPCSSVRGINGSMLKNRSVPADVILPHITYQNVADALVWLKKTFGFTEHYRYGESDERVEGAQMRLGDAWIMLNSVRPGRASPAQLGSQTQSLTVFVANVDAHFEHTKSTGAKILEELHETAYGERQYGAEDLEGHRWLFSQHVRDVAPNEWGATITAV